MNFSEKLTCAIQLHRLTQEELAQATGLSQSTVSQLSNAKQRPYLDQAFKLARILGLSLEFLADDELDREPVGLSEDERYLLRTFRNSTLTADQAVTALIEYAKALGKNMERPTPDDRVELRSGAGSAPVVKPRQEHLVAEETSKAKKPKTRRSRKNNAN